MRPICPSCHRHVPRLVILTVTSAGAVVDVCCRACEAEMQREGFLWPVGSGQGRERSDNVV